jgi:hypothetical protein
MKKIDANYTIEPKLMLDNPKIVERPNALMVQSQVVNICVNS